MLDRLYDGDPTVRVIGSHQLTLEMAEDIVGGEFVLFFDAAAGEPARKIKTATVNPALGLPALPTNLDPAPLPAAATSCTVERVRRAYSPSWAAHSSRCPEAGATGGWHANSSQKGFKAGLRSGTGPMILSPATAIPARPPQLSFGPSPPGPSRWTKPNTSCTIIRLR